MVYKYLIAIAALITVAMLISFLPGHIKQNTAITSIKGFGTYIVNDNGTNFILINGTGTTTNLTLPPTNKFYYSVSLIGTGCSTSGSSPTLINDFYYNNQNSETDFPSNEYLYRANNNAVCSGYAGGSAQTLANNTFVNTLAQKNNRNYANEPNNIGMTTFFVGTNTSFVNGNATATYGSNFILLPIQKGEAVLFLQGNYASGETPTIPSTYFNCPYQVFVQKGAYENPSTFSICYSVYTGTANLSGFTQSTTAILIQQQQTLTFSSTFSYISSSSVVPACYYNNPYKPLVYVNGTLESVTEGSPTQINSSGNLARFDSLYGYGGHNYRNNSGASYQILPNGQLNKPDLWITVPKSLSWIYTPINSLITNGAYQAFGTIPFNPAELAQATLFYSDQQYLISKVGQIQTAVDYLTGSIQGATYTELYQNGTVEQLLKPVFNFTALLSNSTRLLYTNITLQIRIPSNFSTSNISQITDPNLTISYGTDIPNSNYYFYIMPAAYYKEVAAHAANDTYILGTNSTHSGIVYTIPLNKSQIKLVKDTDGFINLNVPAILVFNLNNSDPTGGYYNNVNKSFTAMYYAASYKFSYKIAAPQYTVSLLNAGSKINVTYDSGNTTVMSVYNSKENMSYLDTLNGNSYNSNILLWSYNLNDITYNLEFTSLLNSKLWTSNSIINYNGKNYTTGSNGYINVPVTAGSKINFIDYVFYNTGYEKVQYTNFVTMPYNPCDPITTYAYSLSNTAYINGTIIGTVTGTGQNKTSTGSTGPSTTTPPSNIMSLSYWEYQLKEWGILFGSIIVMGLIAFKFGVDKKGVQNPQVMAIAAIIFVALNLFGLAEGLGNIYITGILVFLAAIIMFEMLLKIFHRGGN